MAEENQIRNDELLEAIKEMRADFNTQTQSKVINMVLRSTFLVPAAIMRNTQLIADKENHLKFQDHPQVRFMLIKNNKTQRMFLPVFTDEDEMAKLKTDEKENYRHIRMKFTDIAQLTETAKNMSGFVINPLSTNLPFPQELLASIKRQIIDANNKRRTQQAAAAQQAEQAGEAKQTPETEHPNITVSSATETTEGSGE